MKPFDEQGKFRMDPHADGVRRLALRGAGATVFSQGLGFAVQMVATVILARLLTPEDFGLVAMVTTFSLLLASFGQIGFPEAIVQRQEIDHALVSNLFWINAGISLVLTVGFALAGDFLAEFYSEPQVADATVGIALTIFLTSVSVPHLALLQRAMRFTEVSAIGIMARFASALVSIALAWGGWGYWALIAGAVTLPLALCVGAWVVCQWIPGLPRACAGTGPMVRFAMNTYGRFTANYFARNMDNLLVGWLFGPAPLGFYKKAYDLFVLPANQLSNPLSTVAVPALSRLTGDVEEYRKHLLKAQSTLALVGMGIGVGLALVGGEVIRLMLGPGWEESGRIFSFFGPGIGIMLLYGTHGWIHLSIGRADRWLRWGIVEMIVTVSLFLLGIPWGPIGIAVAWAASFWILFIPALWYAGKPIHVGVAPVIAAIWKQVLASSMAGLTVVVIAGAIPSFAVGRGLLESATRIGAILPLFGVVYLFAVVVIHGGTGPIRQLDRLIRDMIVPGRSKGS